MTKHINEQVIVTKIMLMLMALLSILLSRMGENVHTYLVKYVQFNIILISHSVITVTMGTYRVIQWR